VVIPCNVGLWLAGGDTALMQTYKNMLGTDPYLGELQTVLNNGGSLTEAVLTDDKFAKFRQLTISAFYNQVVSDTDKIAAHQIYADQGWRTFMDFAQLSVAPANSNLRVIPVGAAGNRPWYLDNGKPARKYLPFPFAPALWDSVVSTSADNGTGVTDYSDGGEVRLDGSGPAAVAGVALTAADLRHGTSFAAPRLSALEAIWLMKTGLADCNGHRPPLGYVSLGDPSSVSYVDLGNYWMNLPQTEWSSKCPYFLAMATIP
jgi:hypothetical protein